MAPSQRPKKIKASRGGGSITLPPELAAYYLRNAVHDASSSGNGDDAEMKALMNMFVEIMGMSPEDASSKTNKNGMPVFSFSASRSNGATVSSSSSSSTSQWPPSAAAAAAAAASGMLSSDGQWSFDYYDEDDDDDDDYDDEEEEDASVADLNYEGMQDPTVKETSDDTAEDMAASAITADEIARQMALDELAAEEERAKKAAKKREKKQRKKVKAKQEAALKAQEAEEKKRSKQIQSWRSRVVAACQSDEDYKIQGLISESPLGKQNEEDVTIHLEFLLPHSIAKSASNEGNHACQKLAAYIVNMSASVAFSIGRNERNALHTACFVSDCYFVKLVTCHTEDVPESSLDLLCKDSGWTALHYAVVSGSQEAMEALLVAGCSISARTDESLTCRASNGEGLTARELAEILSLGKPSDEIETQGTALVEAMERNANNRSLKQRYLRVLRTMATRLKDVEENGYSPPKEVVSDLTESEFDQDVKQRRLSISEDAKKRKKTKKNQKQSEACALTSVANKEVRISAPTEGKVDPLVTALLGMGFTEDQIHDAAKACGGLDRATADQMVMWILSGGRESPISPPEASRVESNGTFVAEAAFVPTSRNNAKTSQAAKPVQQPVANFKCDQKQNMEAVKCEEEARAVAERLAAKRQEQRRRNREWNNRAQARQKEEMEQAAQEEAERIAMERAVVQRQAAGTPALAGKANANSAQARTAQPTAPMQILQRPSHMPVRGIPAGMVSSAMQYPTSAAAPPGVAEASSVMGYYGQYEGMAQYISSGNSVSSAGSGSRYGYAPAPYVSSGNSVSSAGSGMPAMAQYVSSGNSVSSGGSGMQNVGMPYQTQQSMYGHSAAGTIPPPGFHSFGGAPTVSTGSSNISISEETAISIDESSASGEIRATARAFVPTGFKPTVSSAGIAAASTTAPVLITGVGLPPVAQENRSGLTNDDPLASLLSAMAPGTALPSDSGASTVMFGEPSLNSVMGFNLNGSGNRSSLLGSLSVSPATDGSVEDSLAKGTSIWGSTSLAPTTTASLTGFGAGARSSSKTGDAAVGSVSSGMWTSGLTQGGAGLGSIW